MSEDDTLYEEDRAVRTTSWDETSFFHLFRHEIAMVNGDVRIHYMIGGEGPAVVLLHGFPQAWREWRLVMPMLVHAGYQLIAPDLRGFGDSDKPLEGFDVATVGEDIRQLMSMLGIKQIRLVGHDVGASVAYAWAATHPDEVRQLTLIEAFPAGLEPPSEAAPTWKGKPMWHPAFLSTPDLPEVLIANRERALLAYFFRQFAYDPTVLSDADIDAYTRTFAAPGGVRAALAHYRARPKSVAQNQKLSKHPLTMPVLAIGAVPSFGTKVAEAARQFAQTVSGAVAERSGHWIP